jgi:phosphoribosylformylglycinamidine cyclo-ligase
MTSLMYEKAGVSIIAGETLVEKIKKINPNIGGFAGLYPLDEERSLVACTDGVGTKLELGIQMQKYEGLGQDLVAMCVNDLIVCGARPLFFLDYFATGKLDVSIAHRVIKGIVSSCNEANCILLGGETAEMPGFYDSNKFDLAGFAVGEVFHKNLIDGRHIKKNDVIIGLKSSGFHSNGFSLIRKILSENNINLNDKYEGISWGTYLTEPTKIYAKQVLKLIQKYKIKGMSHITGGGLSNIKRILPSNLNFHIEKDNIPTPNFMKEIQNLGKISQEEAFTVWNMGMGYSIIVDKNDVAKILMEVENSFFAGEIIS